MTVTEAGASEIFCGSLATLVTSTFMRSSRLRLVRSPAAALGWVEAGAELSGAGCVVAPWTEVQTASVSASGARSVLADHRDGIEIMSFPFERPPLAASGGAIEVIIGVKKPFN